MLPSRRRAQARGEALPEKLELAKMRAEHSYPLLMTWGGEADLDTWIFYPDLSSEEVDGGER